MSNSTLSGFWVEEWSDLTRFDTRIQTEQSRQSVPEDNLDESILLPSVQAKIVATSQLFFEEPWVNTMPIEKPKQHDFLASTAKRFPIAWVMKGWIWIGFLK